MAFNFTTRPSGMIKWGNFNTLFVCEDQPHLFKAVSSMAEAVACGGIYVQDSTGRYAIFLGQSAVDAVKANKFFFDHYVDMEFTAGDGPRIPDSGSALMQSGVYSWVVKGNTVQPQGEVLVMGVISNATYGYAVRGGLRWATLAESTSMRGMSTYAASQFRDYPYVANPTGGPALMGAAIGECPVAHRGSLMVSIALPKRLHQVLTEQKAAITEGAGDGLRFVEQGLTAELAKPDEILYIPMVTSWRGGGSGRELAVGHVVKDKVYNTNTPDAVMSGEARADQAYGFRFLPKAGGTLDPATLPARAPTPFGATLTDASWMIVRSFEGRMMVADGISLPCPFFHSELAVYQDGQAGGGKLRPTPVDVKFGLSASVGTYAGISTQWALKGALPALVMNPDSSKIVGITWNNTYPTSEMFREPEKPIVPVRALPEWVLPTVPTDADVNQAALENESRVALVSKPVLARFNWENFWSPQQKIEAAINSIYEKAQTLAKAAK